MFFNNLLKGLKNLPEKNLKQLSIVMGVGLLLIFLLLLSLLFIS
jgi:hypothetical protein